MAVGRCPTATSLRTLPSEARTSEAVEDDWLAVTSQLPSGPRARSIGERSRVESVGELVARAGLSALAADSTFGRSCWASAQPAQTPKTAKPPQIRQDRIKD